MAQLFLIVMALLGSFLFGEEPKCKAALHWKAGKLPIRKGQKVGEVHICDENNRLLQKGDLIAAEEVKGTFFFALKEKLAKPFNRNSS